MAINGQAEARFTPNWLFSIGGTALAVISGLGPDLPSDVFHLRLMAPGDPSLSAQPKSRRTLLSLAAGAAVWQLKPALLMIASQDCPIGSATTFITIGNDQSVGWTKARFNHRNEARVSCPATLCSAGKLM